MPALIEIGLQFLDESKNLAGEYGKMLPVAKPFSLKMLGYLRFVFALFVVFTHLSQLKFFGHWGAFGVFGFYLLSGYLITRILHESYHFQFGAFALNRLLRLFPIYYGVALISFAIILLLPIASDFHPHWKMNLGVVDLISNLLILPFQFFDPTLQLVPPVWSIGVELVNYLLLWVLVARNGKAAIAMALLAATYHVVSLVAGQEWTSRYFPSYAAVLPFSLGACIYFGRGYLSDLSPNIITFGTLVSLMVWALNVVICGLVSGLGDPLFSYFFYMNLACLLVLVACLTVHPWNVLFRKSGKIIGDLAYPVFLSHWIIGFVVSLLFLGGQKNGLLLTISLPPILVVSFLLAKLADRWVEPIRSVVRDGARL